MASVSPGHANLILEQQPNPDFVTSSLDVNTISSDSAPLSFEDTLPMITAGPELESILDGYDRILERRLQEICGSQL
jgi:hypothetical protein